MKKIVVTSVAAVVTAVAVAASAVPANAFSVGFSFGGGYGYHGGGVYVDAPVYVHPRPSYYSSDPHVEWCLSRYRTYNPATDLYFYKPGKQRYCISPYS